MEKLGVENVFLVISVENKFLKPFSSGFPIIFE